MAHPVITLSEVANHKAKEDCWLIIRGKVLDVTKFLDEHPGGDDVLVDASGQDATEKFDDVGHSDQAKSLLDEYFIGVVEGYTADDLDQEDKFVKVLPKGIDEKDSSSWSGFLRYLFPLLILGVAFALRFLKSDEAGASS